MQLQRGGRLTGWSLEYGGRGRWRLEVGGACMFLGVGWGRGGGKFWEGGRVSCLIS